MKSNNSWRIRLSQILMGAAIVIALVVVRGAKAGDEPTHLVTDWSHRHLVYSETKSPAKRYALLSDPRYVQQQRRREAERRGDRDEWRWHRAPENPNQLHGDWSMDMGAGATVGAGNYPAKYSFDIASANCATDFVVYNTSLAGTSSQATIVAFNNIYKTTCGATIPTTYWAYNTGSAGTAVLTSPVLSFDGSQVAFVQSTAGSTTGSATLVILRWKANDGTLLAPVTPGAGPCSPAAAPCQITIPFSTANSDGNTADNWSSPFYDYNSDILYVGDNAGFLHKFTGVFFGTPAEVVSTATNFWPAHLTSYGHINSPVFVYGYNQVLLTASDGEFYSVDPTIGGVYPNGYDYIDPKLADTGFDDAPLVDVTTGMVYLFARQSSTFVLAANGIPNGVPGVASVFQIPIPANVPAVHSAAIAQAVVSDSTTIPASAFYAGALDFDYYNTPGTGNLYVCSTHNTVNALWQIPINSMVMSTPILGPTLTSANVACSPITGFSNASTSTDQLFLSVAGSPINCPPNTVGCIMFFDITVSSSWGTATLPAAAMPVTGGTSGIVVDNSSATTGASQVYFTPLGTQTCVGNGSVGNGSGGCAIQASQSTLN